MVTRLFSSLERVTILRALQLEGAANAKLLLLRLTLRCASFFRLFSRSLTSIGYALAIAICLGASPAKADKPLATLFWGVCIGVSDVTQDWHLDARNDLADRVSRVAGGLVHAIDRSRTVFPLPNCIKGNQPGFDRQLMLRLSVKRLKVKVKGVDWNLAIVSGTSDDGLFQDQEFLPAIILQPESVSDDQLVEALVKFFDRSVVESLRRAR